MKKSLLGETTKFNAIPKNETITLRGWFGDAKFTRESLRKDKMAAEGKSSFYSDENVEVQNIYVCPVFNEALQDGKKIKTFHFDGMWGIGTPEDLDYFNKFHGA